MRALFITQELLSSLADQILQSFRTFFLFLLYKVGMKSFLQFVLGVKFCLHESLEQEEQYILVANHNSHADAMALMSSVPAEKLSKTCSIAAGDYFGSNRMKRFFMKMFVNAKLIDRQGGGREVIEKMDRLLKRGKSIIIFPEGSRGEPGEMQEFKKGVAILLQRNPHIPYIPVYLENFDKLMPKGDPFVIPYSSAVRVGDSKFIGANQDLSCILKDMKQDILNLKEGGQS